MLVAEQTNQQERPFLTAEETAEYLGIALPTLYSYTSKRVLPYYKNRRKLYFKLDELNAFVLNSSNRVESREELEEKASAYEAQQRMPRLATRRD
ncbi:MAG: helix-turn-helix domain-containing protein [Candidatus Cloacimonetes bacterium]|nr:helix-turn-helix domain-containing protein [Candidatus Cloacimonadota bacterium]